MTVSISFRGASDGEDGPFDLCSVSAWAALGQWAESLPEDKYPILRELGDEGSAGPTDKLADEVESAMQDELPGGVKGTLRFFGELMGVGAPDEIAVITDEDDNDSKKGD